jgi:hypothetical protein
VGRRIGRWVYDDSDGEYGNAGWHLDGSPVVIDFMPGNHQCCIGGPRCCRGCYLLYNWPGNLPFCGAPPPVGDCEPVALYLRDAMGVVEDAWDEGLLLALASETLAVKGDLL